MGYGDAVQGALAEAAQKIATRSPHEVIAELANEGDPIPLGWAPLDRQMRGGGARAGRIIVLGGPPGSGKTTVLCQVALALSLSYPVYTLFSDEGDEGAATRLGVQMGVPLDRIESQRAAAALEMQGAEGERSLFLVKPDQFESTPERIVQHIVTTHPSDETNLRAAIIFDSIQTIAKLLNGKAEESPRLPVQRLMTLARQWAIAYRILFLMTSRSNRASYRSRRHDENSEDIASFAESSDIEFASDVALVFGLPDSETQVGKVHVVKNRLKGSMLPFQHRYDDHSGRMIEIDASESERQAELAKEEAEGRAMAKLAEQIETLLHKKKCRLSGRQVAELTSGRTAMVIAALRGLESQGVIDWESGPRGALMWGLKA